MHLARITINPDRARVTQQARLLIWDLGERALLMRFLLHDYYR